MTAEPPIDLAHLARYTGGDPATDAEILRLFVTQSAEMLAELEAAARRADRAAWQRAAHSLKGAARGIGAFSLAQIVADAEQIDPAAQPCGAPQSLQALKDQMAAVERFVTAYLAS